MVSRSVTEIFSERSALSLYIKVEAELAAAQADLGIVPREVAEALHLTYSLEDLDFEGLREETARVGYPIAPLVRRLTAACGEHGRWVHWGATTQDILNTALALQINEAWDWFVIETRRIIVLLTRLAALHRDTLMVARTFGGHALPITFGFKVAVWISSLLRHADRLRSLAERPLQGEFAGVAGTLASLGTRGIEVRQRLMDRLDLTTGEITWSAMRDQVFERASMLAGLSGTLGKIAQDIAELSSTEIGELAEPASGGKDSSSTLPFKANPIRCSRAASNATLVGQLLGAVLQAGRQREERSGEGMLEFQALPQLFVHAAASVEDTHGILDGLQVFPNKMRANLGLTRGVILAERYMMALAPFMGRLRAHDLIHEACREAVDREADLSAILAATPEVTMFVSREELCELARPESYLGSAHSMIDSILAQARSWIDPDAAADPMPATLPGF